MQRSRILTPQVAGKRIKKFTRVQESLLSHRLCRHGALPDECEVCVRRRAQRLALQEERIREIGEAQDVYLNATTTASWTDAVASAWRTEPSYWSINTAPNNPPVREEEADEVAF